MIRRDIPAGMGELEITANNVVDMLLPVFRTAAGFVAAIMLAFFGDLTVRVFNLAVGYAWPQTVHDNIYVIFIGIAAGIGAYLCWMTLDRRWYVALRSVVIVLAGGVAGAYLAHFYGPGLDSTYYWSRYATDYTVYVMAAVLSTGLATTLGLLDLAYVRSRLPAYVNPWSVTKSQAPP